VGRRWIVTPFKDYGDLTEEQTDFNIRVSSSRVVVEQAFGILKSRFRYIRGIMRLRDVQFAARLVVACCVLHNVCIRNGDLAGDLIEEENGNDNNGGNNNESGEDSENEHRDSGNSDTDDSDGEAPDLVGNSRTMSLFRQMYPGAVIPQRNRRANNA